MRGGGEPVNGNTRKNGRKDSLALGVIENNKPRAASGLVDGGEGDVLRGNIPCRKCGGRMVRKGLLNSYFLCEAVV
jgi:hypothetical protein